MLAICCTLASELHTGRSWTHHAASIHGKLIKLTKARYVMPNSASKQDLGSSWLCQQCLVGWDRILQMKLLT